MVAFRALELPSLASPLVWSCAVVCRWGSKRWKYRTQRTFKPPYIGHVGRYTPICTLRTDLFVTKGYLTQMRSQVRALFRPHSFLYSITYAKVNGNHSGPCEMDTRGARLKRKNRSVLRRSGLIDNPVHHCLPLEISLKAWITVITFRRIK